MNCLNGSLGKLGKTFGLEEIEEWERDHEEIYEDTCEDLKDEWVPHLNYDVLSLSLLYAWYTMKKVKLTGFGMKDCLTLSSVGWHFLNSLRWKDDEPIYKYTDKCMRHFVRQSLKGEEVGASDQYYQNENSNIIFIFIKKELNINGEIHNFDIIVISLKYIREYEDANEKK